jgi:hypothetical protein
MRLLPLLITHTFFSFFPIVAKAVTKTSTGTGNWSTAGTWSPNGVPTSADDVIIASGHTITMNGNAGNCLSLTINGTANWTQTRTTNVGAGGLALNNAGNISGTATGTLNVSGNFTVGTGTSTLGRVTLAVTGNTTINGILTCNNANGTKTLSGNLTLSTNGALNFTDIETLSIGGNLTTNSGSTITGSATGILSVTGTFTVASGGTTILGRSTINIAGNTTIAGTLSVTSTNGTKTVRNITINSGGNLTHAANEAWTINGNFANNGSFTSGTGTFTIQGAGRVMSGSSTFTFNGRLRIAGGTTTCTNNGTITINNRINGSGSFLQGSTGILNYNGATGNFTVTTFNATASGNLVSYGSTGNQTVRNGVSSTYHHLTIAGGNTKTLAANIIVNGNLTISSTLDVTTNNRNITLGGNWTNTGTFVPRNALVTVNGTTTQTITKATGETFYNLTIAGSGTKLLGGNITVNRDLTIASTLDVSASNFGITLLRNWINNGAFTARNGTVTFSGTTAQTIGGSATGNTFYNITKTTNQNLSLTANQNLQGTLTISAGTFITTGFAFNFLSNSNGTARIATIPSGANITGNITMQRFLSSSSITDWRMIGTAVSGQTLTSWNDDFYMTGFTGSNDPSYYFKSVYTYDETLITPPYNDKDSGFVAATNTNNPVNLGQGFFCYIGPSPITIDVTGAPGKFNQNFTITYNNSGNSFNDGWNLIGNPYPSSIDWTSVSGWTKTNINDAVYVWNPSLQQYASYISGVGTNGGSPIIPSSQAFWVQANANGAALSLTESVKSATDQSFMRMSTQQQISNLGLFVYGNNLQDHTVIRFDNNASLNFDSQLDAFKLLGGPDAPYLASAMSDGDFSINSVPFSNGGVTIPLRLNVSVSGNYQLTKDSLSNIPASACILLEDLLTGIITDLRTVNTYSFQIEDTTSAPRFLLHVSEPLYTSALHPNCVNQTGYATVQGTGTNPWTYIWKDINGNILQTSTNDMDADTLFNLQAGTYIVEVSNTNSICGMVSDTVLLIAPQNIGADFSASTPVSCFGYSDGVLIANISGGTAPYTFAWSTGSTTANISNLLAGNYTLTVNDANGCTMQFNTAVNQPQAITSNFSLSDDTVFISNNGFVTMLNNSVNAQNYIWDFGDQTGYSNSTNTSHYYNSQGNYTISLIALNGNCADTSYKIVTVLNNPQSVNEIDLSEYITATNDNHYLTINFYFENETELNIQLVSSIGQDVLTVKSISVSAQTINLPLNQPAGIYILNIANANELWTKKVVIEK